MSISITRFSKTAQGGSRGVLLFKMVKLSILKQFVKAARRYFAVLWLFCLVTVVLFLFLSKVFASPADDLKEGLRQQINDLQRQIEEYRASVKDLQSQGKTLKREVALFDAKIKAAALEIKQTNLAIQEVENDIADKNLALGQAELKLEREKDIIAEYVRAINEYDQQDMIEIILRNAKLSEIFEEINSMEIVQQKIQESMAAIQQLKVDLQNDRQDLEAKRDDLNQLKVLQEIQRRSMAGQQEEKKNLLAQTKDQEANFQKLLKKAQADAESIRKSLYLLEGVGLSMPLEQAYQYAKKASDLTGTRPAFLLAVLKKESSWGTNMGTGTWRQDMRIREQKYFLQICEKLGFDPDKMPVSHRAWYGSGGAIGPAQFLPSVWLSYEAQVAQLTGHNPPDPWDIEDAFVAAGVKLAQSGANGRTYDSEWKAAQIYFAGRNWNKPAYYFYGDQVMELTAVIQEQLDIIVK